MRVCGRVCTSLAGVVHQDNLLQKRVWRAVDDRVDGSQQRAPRLVVEDDDDAGAGKVIWIQLVLAPSERNQRRGGTFPMSEPQHCSKRHEGGDKDLVTKQIHSRQGGQ